MATHEAPKPTPEDPAASEVVLAAVLALLAQQNQQLREKVTHDLLTGLPNQQQLIEDYAGLQQARKSPRGDHERAADAVNTEPAAHEHSILLGDLDHFKLINDNGGHARGDRVLHKVAKTMQESIRSNDLPVRLHGEEFAVLLPRTTSEQAVSVAEKLRREIEADGDVTISIGVSGLDLDKSLKDNLVNTDTALYQAKGQGRNQVIRFEDMAAEQQAQATAANNGHRP